MDQQHTMATDRLCSLSGIAGYCARQQPRRRSSYDCLMPYSAIGVFPRAMMVQPAYLERPYYQPIISMTALIAAVFVFGGVAAKQPINWAVLIGALIARSADCTGQPNDVSSAQLLPRQALDVCRRSAGRPEEFRAFAIQGRMALARIRGGPQMSNPHEWHIASDKEGDLHEDFAKTISGHTTMKKISSATPSPPIRRGSPAMR